MPRRPCATPVPPTLSFSMPKPRLARPGQGGTVKHSRGNYWLRSRTRWPTCCRGASPRTMLPKRSAPLRPPSSTSLRGWRAGRVKRIPRSSPAFSRSPRRRTRASAEPCQPFQARRGVLYVLQRQTVSIRHMQTQADKRNTYRSGPDERGFFGLFGGRFVAETLMPLILELERAYDAAKADPNFRKELAGLNQHYSGRPSPLYFAERLTQHLREVAAA